MSKQSVWPPLQVRTLERYFIELSESVGDPDRVKARTDDEQIWLTRFLVVRSSGFVEQVVYESARGYLAERSFGMVRTFSHSWIERTRNPSPANLLLLLGRFDGTLAELFSDFLDEDDGLRRQNLELLVQRRNEIAHGQNEGMGIQKALRVAETAREVADWFIRELAPDASRPLN